MNRSGEIAAALLLMKPGVAHGIRDARALRCLGRDEIVEHIAGPDHVERQQNVLHFNRILGVCFIDGAGPQFDRFTCAQGCGKCSVVTDFIVTTSFAIEWAVENRVERGFGADQDNRTFWRVVAQNQRWRL